MLNKIFSIIRKIRIKHMKWGNINNFYIGKEFKFIGTEKIYIGDNFYAEENLRLQAWERYGDQIFSPEIKIGKDVSMMENCQISCCNNIVISDGCLFGANVFVTDNFHGDNHLIQSSIIPIKRKLNVKGKVIIEENVWIGRNVCIMPGVRIGYGAVVGANSVVTHDIPPQSVAAGIPAKIIRSLD